MNFLISQGTNFTTRVVLLCLFAGILSAQSRPVDSVPGLTAHEWGTFTSVAGNDGQAVEWVPLSLNDLSFDENAGDRYRSKELPSFVETLHWGAFKVGLPATIRMETPVLYFYAPHQMMLSVQVKFLKGLITEWYPHAAVPVRHGGLDDAELYRKHAANGSISWNTVTLQPSLPENFPRDSADNNNRYYAARETLSTPLRVPAPGGDQHEKFLFYRGVSEFSIPVAAAFTAEGKLLVRNSLKQGISNIIWFERRGDKVGYRISDGIENEAQVILEPPELTATVEHLYGDLEQILAARGLYPEEAHAMVQTWRNSWFEEGSRLFYIVPTPFVDEILPLTIIPAPAETVRVFVGRLELISPATQKAVVAALASNDQPTLAKYGRFLEPILKTIKSNPELKKQLPASEVWPCAVDNAGSQVAKRGH